MHSASHVRAAEASITGASSCWHAGCTHHMPHRQPHSGAAMRACASSRTRVLRRQAGSLQRRAMSPSIQHSRVASSTTQVAARADGAAGMLYFRPKLLLITMPTPEPLPLPACEIIAHMMHTSLCHACCADSLSDAIQLPTCQEDTIAAVVTGNSNMIQSNSVLQCCPCSMGTHAPAADLRSLL